MDLRSKNDISGRLAIWAIICLNLIATALYLFVPDVEYKDHIFYVIVYAVLILGIFLIARVSNYDIIGESGLKKKTDFVCYIFVGAIAIGLLYFGSFFANTIYYAMESFGYVAPDTSIVIETPIDLVLNLLTVAVLPAFVEEMLVRGGIFTSFKKRMGIVSAILLSSMFFALLHGSVVQTVHQFIVGVACATLLYTGGSIWYAIALHFFNNAIAVVITYLEPIIYGGEIEMLTASEYFTMYNLIPQALMAALGLVISLCVFNAFIRRMERAKNIDYIPEPYSLALVARRIKGITADEPVANKERGVTLEKVLFWASVIVTILVIALDIFAGFIR